ncbi:FAD-dependent oxidoreductase [Roseibacterium sp. SDUM158016]|uniref:NAD(P)/FAD-dependent oxidoreductase n=1 Tax=Roseicyclus sediminis TaxID=2980997 RepID=UPI0021D33240|nr:FAD-dependent oxidoreductase [Roseibacterium sp. SDUM158016]MCU4651627.1 FAD-dependent oxidoreductase [Roseibacterium sp. SDUM158016]
MHIVVRGAGIFGLSIAWACVERGERVSVVDPHGPGAGASGGLVGALAPHVPEAWNTKKALQFESLAMAEGFWAGVGAATGLDPLYARAGRIQPLADADAVDRARERAASAHDLWQGRYRWEILPADTFPGLVDSPTGLVVHDTLSARLHPRQALAALVRALAAKGVSVTADAPKGDTVIHATGVAGLWELNGIAGNRIVGAGVKGQAATLARDLGPVPQVYADGLHIVPHGDGTVAIGSTSEREWDDPASTDEKLDEVIAAARAACPALRDAPVIERWAGLRPRARSRAPMLGRHPLHDGEFIANGGFKIGFGMAPLVAKLMADLVIAGIDAIPPEFRPEASLA